jgi:probable HAF family extracellular repeat protein
MTFRSCERLDEWGTTTLYLRCGRSEVVSWKTLVLMGAVSGAAAALSQSAAAGSFAGIGDLPGGYEDSMALAISADGRVVAGRSESANGAEAFRWSVGSGMVGLGDLPGADFFSEARGVSADGSVIVGTGRSEIGDEPFRWTSDGGLVGLGDFPDASCPFCQRAANGVSADGSVVVGYATGLFNFEAFRWTAETGMVRLGTFGDNVQTLAEAVSADGSVVVGRTNTEGFRWTAAEGMTGLGDLGGQLPFPVSEAYGISADGSVIVGGARDGAGQDQAFRWTAGGGMEGIGILAGEPFTAAGDSSADGSVVVGIARGFFTGRDSAFIWTRVGGMRSLKAVLETDHGLDLSGWTLLAATAVSDDGQTIAGYGINPDSVQEAWVATLEPAPVDSIEIDIEPRKTVNRLMPGSPAKVRVAILSSGGFDAGSVDPASVRFGPAGASPVRPYEKMKDVDRDGRTDLVLAFRTSATGIACGDTDAPLAATTFDGVVVRGSDSIVTGKCGKERSAR